MGECDAKRSGKGWLQGIVEEIEAPVDGLLLLLTGTKENNFVGKCQNKG